MYIESLELILLCILTKDFSSRQVSFTYSLNPTSLQKIFFPTLGQTTAFFRLPNSRDLSSTFLSFLWLLSSPDPLPIHQLKSSHHGFVGQMETKSPQMYLSRVPLLQWHQTSLQSASLGKTLLSGKVPCGTVTSEVVSQPKRQLKLKMLAGSRQLGQGQYQKLISQAETITERFAGTDVKGKINLNSSLGSEKKKKENNSFWE